MGNLLYILVGLIGYLLGSLSFARIVVHIVSPESDLSGVEVQVPASQARFQSSSISATSVNTLLGPRFGCLTSLLDMTKVGLPALLLKLIFPEFPYFLIYISFGTLGHIWPLYYRFKGGRGMSAILAGFAVADWQGVLITLSISLIVGLIRKDFYIGNKLSILLMIPWLWFRTQSWMMLLFAISLNLMNLIAAIPEIKEIKRLRKEGRLKEFLRAETVQVYTGNGTENISRKTFYGEYKRLIGQIKKWLSRRFP